MLMCCPQRSVQVRPLTLPYSSWVIGGLLNTGTLTVFVIDTSPESVAAWPDASTPVVATRAIATDVPIIAVPGALTLAIGYNTHQLSCLLPMTSILKIDLHLTAMHPSSRPLPLSRPGSPYHISRVRRSI